MRFIRASRSFLFYTPIHLLPMMFMYMLISVQICLAYLENNNLQLTSDKNNSIDYYSEIISRSIISDIFKRIFHRKNVTTTTPKPIISRRKLSFLPCNNLSHSILYSSIPRKAYSGELPWIVSLSGPNNRTFCGGTIVDTKWIVTAAHCLNDYPIDMIKVVLGNNLNEPYKIINISTVYIHPEYNSRTLENDIALFSLSSEISFNLFTSAVCLPNPNVQTMFNDYNNNTNEVRQNIGIIGGYKENELKIISVSIMNKDECNKFTKSNEEAYICIKNGKCIADSGASLITIKNNKPILIGIESWGEECIKPDKPGIFTNVEKYISFFNETIS